MSDHFRIGRIGYGINLALTHNYETGDGDDVARIDSLGRPTDTIVLVDAWQLAVDLYGIPGWEDGCSWVYPFDRTGSSNVYDGVATSMRHQGVCSVLWADGHVRSVRATAPDARPTIYDDGALGDLWTAPDSLWDRK